MIRRTAVLVLVLLAVALAWVFVRPGRARAGGPAPIVTAWCVEIPATLHVAGHSWAAFRTQAEAAAFAGNIAAHGDPAREIPPAGGAVIVASCPGRF